MRKLLCISLLVVVAGCGGRSDDNDAGQDGTMDDGSDAGEGDGSDGSTSNVDVSQGVTPEYSWEGGNVSQLSVLRAPFEQEIYAWAVITRDTDGISSPVVHGTTPPGAEVLFEDELELTAGVEYHVFVRRMDGSMENATFTP